MFTYGYSNRPFEWGTDYYGNVSQQVRLLAVFPPEDRADDGAEDGGS
jgi:hypothetical protein